MRAGTGGDASDASVATHSHQAPSSSTGTPGVQWWVVLLLAIGGVLLALVALFGLRHLDRDLGQGAAGAS